MPRGIRFTAEQMNQVITECNEGKSRSEVSRKYGVSDKTISKWILKFKGQTVSDIRRTKFLEEENARLKRMIANMAIDIDALKEINSKKW